MISAVKTGRRRLVGHGVGAMLAKYRFICLAVGTCTTVGTYAWRVWQFSK